MQDIRCSECSKKLGAGQYIQLSIKCPRCKSINNLSAESTTQDRRGATFKGSSHASTASNTLARRKTPPS